MSATKNLSMSVINAIITHNNVYSDTTLKNSLERILECAVCQEPMNDAVMLHCGHAFCRHCLNRSIQSNRNSCPLCRKALTHKERFERDFPPVLIVKNIADALSDHTKPGPSRQRLMCRKHPQNENKYACERCQKPVCSECLIVDHWQCSSSRPKTIVEIEQEMQSMVDQSEKWISDKKNFDNFLSPTRTKSALAVEAMTDTQRQMEEAYEATLRNLRREKERMSAIISEKTRRLVEKKMSLERQNKEITRRANLISSDKSCIKEVLKRKHPDDIIKTYGECSKRFKANLANPMPSLTTVETEYNDAISTYFKKSNSSFGEICKRARYEDTTEEDYDSYEDDDEQNDLDYEGNEEY